MPVAACLFPAIESHAQPYIPPESKRKANSQKQVWFQKPDFPKRRNKDEFCGHKSSDSPDAKVERLSVTGS